ncbi:MAG: Rrf2 family transcriptional regulator [candidate division Zixibacteria bacterium]|nr:Rrf2 family transcriptional regulator [candidate division Zixibacteria bacterium]
MRVGTQREYAMRCMVTLSRAYEFGSRKPLPVSVIAKRHGLSRNYVEQLLIKLRKADLIVSKRGAEGGYILASSPTDMKIADIFKALRPQDDDEDDLLYCKDCDEYSEECGSLCLLWEGIAGAINQVIENHTLAAISKIMGDRWGMIK